ncbi:hypothetical protein LX36DRAFT_709504 [Colletotrichum falcatum]|nr:hypothetical protein LX36DRAFT_709504 [Colletotrichum falcatum]
MAIDQYFENWRKHQVNPGAQRPVKVTINPTDSFWPVFQKTPFFKSANYAFKAAKKTVVMRDWITQNYLQGDTNDFRSMLAAHKSTINIALANANLRMKLCWFWTWRRPLSSRRRIAAISPEVLDSYTPAI